MKIAFYWQGISGVYGHWNDGLRGAMKLIEEKHTVYFLDTHDPLPEDAEVILYWEAPVTCCGKDRENYVRIQEMKKPKILLFAGGQIKREWVEGFDLLLVESKINADECDALGIPQMTAFGVNIDIMKPDRQPKVFDAAFPGTCAGWKRHGLFGEALKDKGVVCGRFQQFDSEGFLMARKHGSMVFPELTYEAVNVIYNASHCCVNTSSYWGGGQRVTLEAMAAGIPVICMSDSPKNREYVEESGAGLVVDPSPEAIRKAVDEIKTWTPEQKARGRKYVENKWTHHHYAENILKGIDKVLNNGK